MRPIKEQQQAHARNLYFQSGLTRTQIAEQVGVSEKTIYLWTKQGDWQRLKEGSRLMPSMIVEHIYAQVQELNEAIASRPIGQRYPTPQEAEIQRKQMVTIERIKKKGTQGEYMELMQKFMTWLLPRDLEQTKAFTALADQFLKDGRVAGFHPYDIEYGSSALMSAALPSTARIRPDDEEYPSPDPNQLSLFPENAIPPLTAMSPAPSAGGDRPDSATAENGQGDIQPSPALQPNQSPQHKLPPAPLVEKGPGDEALPLFRGDSSEEATADSEQGCVKLNPAPRLNQSPLSPLNDEHVTTGTPSLSPLKDEHAMTGTPSLSPLKDKDETTGNNSNQPYEAPTATFNYNPDTKQEITPTGNNQAIPHLRGDSSGSTNVDNGQGCVQSGHEQKPDRKKPKKDTSISIGYIGTQEEVLPDGSTILEIKKEDPGIQKFSIGDAIYYIKKKE